jgi:CHAT domain-containing protein/tetratricopeptide (TPR) repeat protein
VDLLRSVQGKTSASIGAQAVGWRARAESLLYAGEYKAARSAYEKACSCAVAASEHRLLGQILVGRIGTLLVMGDFRSIHAMTRQAEALLRRHDDQEYLRRLHINLGSGLYHREKYAEAYASFAEALRLMEAVGQRDDLWASLTLNFGIACSQLARVEEARDAFAKVEAYGRAHAQDRMVAQAVFNLGALEGLRGGYRAALRSLTEAEEAFVRQGVQELLAATHLEQAQIYLDLSMATEGKELAQRAASAFTSEGMLLDAQLARIAEARSLVMLGRPKEAEGLLRDAERFYRAQHIAARRAQALLDIALAMSARDETAAAMQVARSALRVAERLRLGSLTCACRCLIAELLLRAGAGPKAERALAGIAPGLSKLPMRDRLEYWSTAARVAAFRGMTALAGRRYRRATQCLEAQRALIPGLELRTRSFEQNVRVYHEKIALLAGSRRPPLDRILLLMERARGRTFRELVAARGRQSQGEIAELRAVLGSLVRRLDHLVMGGRPAAPQEVEPLRRQVVQLEHQITSRVRRIETTEGSVTGGGSFRRSSQIVPLLAADEVMIEYFVAKDRILAAVVGKQERFLRTLEAPLPRLRDLLDHFGLQLESLAATASRPLGGQAFLRRSAEAKLEEFYSLLLRPILGDLPPCGRLTIIPHDILHQIPFECLHDGAQYLDRSWQITRCPTADFLIERRSRSRGVPVGNTVVIAGTRPGSPFIEVEARRVLDSWDPSSSLLLVDPSSADALAAMKEARVIHVSAHGNFRGDNPLFSTLHLGREVLFLADILETPLTADLAVLSSCDSGQTFSGRGDALLGVAHAFLAAGTERLVASLWRVHDQATASWMEAFHRALRESGDAPAARLHACQVVREEWPHPFYWGGFSVLGG